HFRREAHSISFSEVPMVLGLFFTSPQMVVLAVLTGSAAALLIHRRQRPLKLAFNLATFALNATTIVAVFGVTTAANPNALSPRCWGATFLAVGVGGLVSVLLVSSAISLAEGKVN